MNKTNIIDTVVNTLDVEEYMNRRRNDDGNK